MSRSQVPWLKIQTASFCLAWTLFAVLAFATHVAAQGSRLVTGKKITPVGINQNVASLPMNIVLSPNGKYAITSDMGFRQFLSSISTATGQGMSKIEFPNTAQDASNGLYYGIAFGPDGTLYAAQGQHATIAVLTLGSSGQLTQTGSIKSAQPTDFPSGLSTDSRGYLFVSNNDPDLPNVPGSISAFKDGLEVGRFSFNDSFGGTPNFPLSMVTTSDGNKTYVASQRDSAVYVLDTRTPAAMSLLTKMPTGSHPSALLFNKKETRLFVANAHSDTVSVIATDSDSVIETLLVRSGRLKNVPGATPIGLALSPDQKTLYIALGDMNAVAVANFKNGEFKLRGYIPAGWYPSGLVSTVDGKRLLVANAKGIQTRYPNPGYKLFEFNDNPQYDLNQIEGSVLTIGVPGQEQLEQYTKTVFANNGLSSDEDKESEGKQHAGQEIANSDNEDGNLSSSAGLGAALGKIKHVIYIVKENRTYDQVLGDLPQGNGDPSLVLFGSKVTPSQHALAQRFVLLDNYYVTGEASGDGWPWSTQSMANEYVIKDLPYNYSGRGRNYDFEGQNNGYLTGGFPATGPDGKLLSVAYPNGAPAIPDVAEAPGGHIWDKVRAAGLSYRNYGFFYSFGVGPSAAPILPDNYPASAGLRPAGFDLSGISDYDYRRYDNGYADSDAPTTDGCSYGLKTYGRFAAPSRFSEWSREFQLMLKKDPTGNSVPALMTVRFNHDHTQGFNAGDFTPQAEVADNDYAVGQLVEAISKSPIWESTAIFVIEDDAQDGPDHVDAHRSTAYVISPWIKQGVVDHRFYNTDSILKTMEVLLGVGPLTQYDAIATPIQDFESAPANKASFTASAADQSIMCDKAPALKAMRRDDPMRKWALESAKLNFDRPDSAPSDKLNLILWKSVKGPNAVMPKPHHGLGANTQKD